MPKRTERKEYSLRSKSPPPNSPKTPKSRSNSPSPTRKKRKLENELENDNFAVNYTPTSLLRSIGDGEEEEEAMPLVRTLRSASFHTKEVLNEQLLAIHSVTPQQRNARKVLNLLRKSFLPVKNYNYDGNSHRWANKTALTQFQRLLLPLCETSTELLRKEEMIVKMKSPTYVLGDLHGNYKDLMLFKDRFWSMGLDMTPARLLFLGDYVDRGPHSVELISYLFALKILHPNQVILLRGNHEFEDQNGDMEYEPCFLSSLRALFTKSIAQKLWKFFNSAFDVMPLVAIIDEKIFCCHGGIPRIVKDEEDVLRAISKLKRPLDQKALEGDEKLIAFDLVWADPATKEEEEALDDDRWFGDNDRGEDAIVFGEKSVRSFMHKTGCSHLIRAHQPPDHGIEYSKGARIITVFSSSHYCGGFNSAAIVLVNDGRLRVATTKNMEMIKEYVDDAENEEEEVEDEDEEDCSEDGDVVADEDY